MISPHELDPEFVVFDIEDVIADELQRADRDRALVGELSCEDRVFQGEDTYTQEIADPDPLPGEELLTIEAITDEREPEKLLGGYSLTPSVEASPKALWFIIKNIIFPSDMFSPYEKKSREIQDQVEVDKREARKEELAAKTRAREDKNTSRFRVTVPDSARFERPMVITGDQAAELRAARQQTEERSTKPTLRHRWKATREKLRRKSKR